MAARKIVHLSVEQRRARGREARDRTPLDSHTGWAPATDRPDPVALLEEQDATREPDLVPVRHGRMLVSPFTFYRGAAKIMAADLAATPTAGLQVQLCGDAHLSNFGRSPPPSGICCSASTTSTRPSRDRSTIRHPRGCRRDRPNREGWQVGMLKIAKHSYPVARTPLGWCLSHD